jgi:hypothetical protein
MHRTSMLLCAALTLAAAPAFAQGANDKVDPRFDFKPFIAPVLPPLPPSSYITPGAVGGVTQSPYTTPFADEGPKSLPAPGLRLTIPTR